MLVHTDINRLPYFTNAVLTIGTFDGVHQGHRQIIQQLKETARAVQGETVIITFHPHPRSVVPGKKPVGVLNTVAEKTALLEKIGIDHLVIIPFDLRFSQQSAEEFIRHFLVEKFHPHTIIIGYDHRFGKDRSGDYKLMEKMGQSLGFAVKEIPEQVLNHVTVSSTRIREALIRGQVETANNYLGYDYFFDGQVVEGKKIGRELGYPTANIFVEEEEKLIPAIGIYAVEVLLENEMIPRKAMMSIGLRPVLGGTPRTIEVHIFDLDKNLYGQQMQVFVKYYMRDEVNFKDLDALKIQLEKDKAQALAVLSA